MQRQELPDARRDLAEKGIRRQAHRPVQGKPLLGSRGRNAWQRGVAEWLGLLRYRQPDAGQDCQRFSTRAVDGLPCNDAVQQGPQKRADVCFRLASCEAPGRGIEPRDVDPAVEADRCPLRSIHVALVIVTKGTMTSSRQMPP